MIYSKRKNLSKQSRITHLPNALHLLGAGVVPKHGISTQCADSNSHAGSRYLLHLFTFLSRGHLLSQRLRSAPSAFTFPLVPILFISILAIFHPLATKTLHSSFIFLFILQGRVEFQLKLQPRKHLYIIPILKSRQ